VGESYLHPWDIRETRTIGVVFILYRLAAPRSVKHYKKFFPPVHYWQYSVTSVPEPTPAVLFMFGRRFGLSAGASADPHSRPRGCKLMGSIVTKASGVGDG
jgi:hypothetical protein